MKLYRAGRKSSRWSDTDAKVLTQWAKKWSPKSTLTLDGTIDKGGRRHTDFGIRFTPDDIVALHAGCQRYQKKFIKDLEKRNTKLLNTVSTLEQALHKISRLVSLHSGRAPSREALLEAVRHIADHYRWSFQRSKPLDQPKWLKWRSI